MNLILRAMFLVVSFYMVIIFLAAITHDTGNSSIYPFIIPIIGSIGIILFLQKTNYAKWINYLPLIFIVIGFSITQGTFINYTIIGLSMFMLFFNAIRPWRN
ncbi:MAG: hypothetical protein DRG78_01960 [Epsilonproteobacteria bacterium]|nr:MAG: hypothetical protein DRG78_01960 [Campylobacterota bacterium]